MSRPSATQSPAPSSRRCSATIARRTAGSAATREAASDTAGVRISSVTSRPSSSIRSPGSIVSDAAIDAPVTPRSMRGQRDRSVHRAGVQVGEAERVGDGARHRRLAGAGRPVDRATTDHAGTSRSPPRRRRTPDRTPRRPPSRPPRRPPPTRARRPRRAAPAGGRRGRRGARRAARRSRVTTNPSGNASMSAPRPRSPSTTRRDPVGLLDPQLGGAADDRVALGEATEQRDQRKLVDRERHLVGLDGRAPRSGRPSRRCRRSARARSNVPGGSRSASTIAPIRSRIRRNPARVQLTPTRSSTSREPRTSTPAAIRNAAEDRSPGTSTDRARARRCCRTVVRNPPPRRRPSRATGAPARASIRSVWSRVGTGSITVVASVTSPASSTHDLTWRARHRELVVDPGERRAVDGERREPALARLDPRAHQRQRLGDPVDRTPADRVVAVELEARALLEGEPARQQPHQGAGVADVDRLVLRERVAHAAPADHQLAVVARSTIAPSWVTAASVERVSAASR